MEEMLGPFFAPDAKLTSADGKLRITLPDGRAVAFAFAGFEFHNPNAKPMKDDGLLKDFLDRRAGKPDDPEGVS